MLYKLFQKTPLAWLQIKKEKNRFAVALAGIAFADVLMFVQLGLNDALYESAANFQNSLDGDLFIVNPISEQVQAFKTFPRERVYQVAGLKGVKTVSYLYLGRSQWRNPQQTTRERAILTIGIDPAKSILNLEAANQQLDKLKLLDSVLFDQTSRPEFGEISTLFKKYNQLVIQANDKKIKIVGLFTLGVSFGMDGTMITSDSTFLRLFPQRQPEQVDVGLIKLKPNVNLKQMQTALQAYLPKDILVLTREEFGNREKKYWADSTSTGFIFGFGTLVGFGVGMVVVYQILYSNVSDHLPEYATLKAMGYDNIYFVKVLIQEAIILAVLGYMPGFVVASGLYSIAKSGTLLPISMTLYRAVLVLSLTITMCTISAVIAMRKLQQADPSEILSN